VYRWLKTRRFDIVHYHEWRGIGAYLAQAKRQGLAFSKTLLVAGAHSPTLWHLEGMRELANAEQLEVDFLERQSVANADVLWSPSRHMLDWLRREDWTLPKRIVLKPYILLDLVPAAGRRAVAGAELVFFGRLETRKGLDLFCDALDRIAAGDVQPRQVTFLGKPANVQGMPSVEYLKKRAVRWSFRWRIVSNCDRDAAMAYLRKPNRVAVLPSRIDNLPYTVLECLGSSIPFVAANTGGIPEMIRPADRERTLFALTPESFAARLSAVLRDGLSAAPLRISAARIERDWIRWHDERGRTCSPQGGKQVRPPVVSVCMTTRNRPALLREAIASIRRQTYKRLELVLVDDGSDQPAATRFLDRLQPDFDRRGWKIIRQPNRYLGAARNAAIAAATGDFVMFMDDDNVAERNEIEVFQRVAATTGADILTCFLAVYRTASRTLDGTRTHTWPFLGAALGPGVLRNVFGDANAFVRRDVFARIGGFTEDFGLGCEDWEFFARASLRGLKLQVVPETLVRYRQSPTGMLQSTSLRANQARALRPYVALLPPHLRGLVHLGSQQTTAAPEPAAPPTTQPVRLDDVRRAVVFGAGEAGRLAIGLAQRAGWNVPWIIDNNRAMWNRTAHDRPVRAPASLTKGGFDLVLVASLAGKVEMSKQLEKLGLTAGEQFVHFLDPIRVGGVTMQLALQ